MFSRCFPFARRAWLMFALTFLLPAPAHSHGPFDNSVRLILLEGSLEVMVTLGPEAAASFLKDGPREALQPRTSGFYPLPQEYAARLCELKAGSQPLVAKSLGAHSDGLEVAFVAVYPRPATGPLDFRARYFDGIPELRRGAVVLVDENGNQLGSGLLSKETASAELSLPASALPPPTPKEPALAQSTGSSASEKIPAITLPESAAAVAAPVEGKQPSFGEFLKLGVEHILTGYDHLLFLCALLVVCRRVAPMLAIITCFTLAHSLTLALAALDVVQIPPRIVEPLIAASIVFVGLENFRGQVNTKARCAVTLGFGLIHGFGFANVLRETGLGAKGLALARPLFAFNVGVECGQLVVAALFLPLLFWLRRAKSFDRFGIPAISTVVLALGSFWLVQRVLF